MTVNDDLIKRVCHLFASNPTVKHLYLDKTAITLEGFKSLLEAIKIRRNVRTISVKECNLSLVDSDGE